MNSIELHNIENITVRKTKELTNNNSHARDIEITDDENNKVCITVFNDDEKNLEVELE